MQKSFLALLAVIATSGCGTAKEPAFMPDPEGGAGWTIVDDVPYPRSDDTAVLDEGNDRLIVFGGLASDTWALPLSGPRGNVWTELATTGDHPSARLLRPGPSAIEFDAAIHALPQDSDVWQRAALLVDAGLLQHRRRRLDRAHAFYTEALALYDVHGSVRQQARVLGDIGSIHHDRCEFQNAESHYRRALVLLRRAEDPRLEGNLLANLGLLAAEQGQFDEADASLTRAEAALELAEDRRLLGIVRGNTPFPERP
jgi:tetratricopeptide (TPR) repeat protein